MYKIYIDNFELPESDIVDFLSIKVERTLEEVYWGYWNADGFGFSDTNINAKITIENFEIVEYIKRIFERDGFGAEIKVTLVSETSQANLLIDFSEYAEPTCCTVQIGLKTAGGGQLLLNRDKISYPIELSETIKVPIRNLPSIVNFKVGGEQFGSIINTSPNHYIPLTKTEDNFVDSTSNSISVGDVKPFFTSTNEQCLEVSGSIKVNASSIDLGDFSVYLKVDSETYLIDVFPLSATIVEHTITLNQRLLVQPNEQISLYIESTNSDLFQYVYDDASDGISITKCSVTDIELRDVKAVSLKNAFKGIVNRITGGRTQIGTYLFDNEPFDIFLTSNEGLQNKLGTINVSLFELFDELNNKYPTSIDITDTVDIRRREDFIEPTNIYDVEAIEVSREINSNLVYSDIKVGYNSWKAENTNFGSIEHNGKREYEARVEVGNNSLSLLNDWSASASEINQGLEKLKAKDQIFSIVVIKNSMKAETNEYIGANIYEYDRAVNLRITPGRNLNRYKKFLLTDYDFASGEGNYNFDSRDTLENTIVDENKNLDSEPIIGKFKYKLLLDSCGVEQSRLRGAIRFKYCEITVVGIVSLVSYATGDEQIEVECIELI